MRHCRCRSLAGRMEAGRRSPSSLVISRRREREGKRVKSAKYRDIKIKEIEHLISKGRERSQWMKKRLKATSDTKAWVNNKKSNDNNIRLLALLWTWLQLDANNRSLSPLAARWVLGVMCGQWVESERERELGSEGEGSHKGRAVEITRAAARTGALGNVK